MSGNMPARAGSWSTWPRKRTKRPHGQCWTTTMKSNPARPTRRKIPTRTRPMPSTKKSWTFSRISKDLAGTASNYRVARLRRRYRPRCLRAGKRHTDFAPVQTPDRAGHLEHPSGGARGVLNEGDLIGGKHQGFGFEDGLGKARKRNRA